MEIETFEKNFLAETEFCIRGDKEQLYNLYMTMNNLVEKRILWDKDVYYINNIQNLALALGEDKDIIYRATWSRLSIKVDLSLLQFNVETIGQDPEEIVHFLNYKFPGLEIFFRCTLPNDEHHYTNDRDGVFFPYRFVLENDDDEEDKQYFNSREEAQEYIESLIGREIEPGEDFNGALYEWGEYRAKKRTYLTYREYELV